MCATIVGGTESRPWTPASAVKKLVALHHEGRADAAEPLARLLLDYAKIAEGQVDDAAGFSKRLSALMEQAGQGL